MKQETRNINQRGQVSIDATKTTHFSVVAERAKRGIAAGEVVAAENGRIT